MDAWDAFDGFDYLCNMEGLILLKCGLLFSLNTLDGCDSIG